MPRPHSTHTYTTTHTVCTTTTTSRKGRGLLGDVTPLSIIREVEKWPVLYIAESPEGDNVVYKTKVWHEIAKDIVPDFDLYSRSERHTTVIELMKKWRKYREGFKRQLELRKMINEGHDVEMKEFIYFQYMTFLIPHIELSESRAAPPDEAGPGPAPAAAAAEAEAEPPRQRYRRSHHTHYDHDEDKHFALSLVSSLKNMTEDEKAAAKANILKVITNVMMSSDASAFPDSVTSPDNFEMNTEDPEVKVESFEEQEDN